MDAVEEHIARRESTRQERSPPPVVILSGIKNLQQIDKTESIHPESIQNPLFKSILSNLFKNNTEIFINTKALFFLGDLDRCIALATGDPREGGFHFKRLSITV